MSESARDNEWMIAAADKKEWQTYFFELAEQHYEVLAISWIFASLAMSTSLWKSPAQGRKTLAAKHASDTRGLWPRKPSASISPLCSPKPPEASLGHEESPSVTFTPEPVFLTCVKHLDPHHVHWFSNLEDGKIQKVLFSIGLAQELHHLSPNRKSWILCYSLNLGLRMSKRGFWAQYEAT